MTAYEQARHNTRKLIRENFCRAQAYRDLVRLERAEGNEIEARRWIAYRADALRNIRLLRDATR